MLRCAALLRFHCYAIDFRFSLRVIIDIFRLRLICFSAVDITLMLQLLTYYGFAMPLRYAATLICHAAYCQRVERLITLRVILMLR